MLPSLEILEILEDPLFSMSAVNVGPGGRKVERTTIPVLDGRVRDLPEGLEAIIATSDLQCHDRSVSGAERPWLMGSIVAEELARRADRGELPPAEQTGVILAGDFHADPQQKKRGGAGDVQSVWQDFALRFRWVIGVAGNHDLFDGIDRFGTVFDHLDNVHALDGRRVVLDGLGIGGVSGILGNIARPWRHHLDGYLNKLDRACGTASRPSDILVQHEAPAIPSAGLRGHPDITEALALAKPKPQVLVCGHCHWPGPLATLPDAEISVLNVDSRVVVLRRADGGA